MCAPLWAWPPRPHPAPVCGMLRTMQTAFVTAKMSLTLGLRGALIVHLTFSQPFFHEMVTRVGGHHYPMSLVSKIKSWQPHPLSWGAQGRVAVRASLRQPGLNPEGLSLGLWSLQDPEGRQGGGDTHVHPICGDSPVTTGPQHARDSKPPIPWGREGELLPFPLQWADRRSTCSLSTGQQGTTGQTVGCDPRIGHGIKLAGG